MIIKLNEADILEIVEQHFCSLYASGWSVSELGFCIHGKHVYMSGSLQQDHVPVAADLREVLHRFPNVRHEMRGTSGE